MTVISIQGPMGTGKSSFAATFPGNSYWQDSECGANRGVGLEDERHRIWQPARDGGLADEILEMIDYTVRSQVKGMIKFWDVMSKDYVRAITDSWADTIIQDTWKDVWTVCHRSYLELLQASKHRESLQPIEYATPNARMSGWIHASRAMGKNLILISHERNKYVPGMDSKGQAISIETNEKELDGFGKTTILTDWAFLTSFENGCTLGNGHKCQGFHFKAKILKSPIGAEFVGMTLTDPSFDTLVSLAETFNKKVAW